MLRFQGESDSWYGSKILFLHIETLTAIALYLQKAVNPSSIVYMSASYSLKVTFDHQEEHEIFRDIVLSEGQTLDVLHNAIIKAFDLNEGEMASFYEADENWDRGEEYPLMDMGDAEENGFAPEPMHKVAIEKVTFEGGDRMLYVYDFMNMHTFLVELMSVGKAEKKEYPLFLDAEGDVDFSKTKDPDFSEDDDADYYDPDLEESYLTEFDDEEDNYSDNDYSDDYY